jgi:hypothetical protein
LGQAEAELGGLNTRGSKIFPDFPSDPRARSRGTDAAATNLDRNESLPLGLKCQTWKK